MVSGYITNDIDSPVAKLCGEALAEVLVAGRASIEIEYGTPEHNEIENILSANKPWLLSFDLTVGGTYLKATCVPVGMTQYGMLYRFSGFALNLNVDVEIRFATYYTQGTNEKSYRIEGVRLNRNE